MMKNLICILTIAAVLIACTDERERDTSFQKVEPAVAPVVSDSATPLEKIKAVALEESDTMGRVRQSFVSLQEEYKKAKGVVTGIGEVNVLIDEQFTLLIDNKFEGHVYQTKVKLRDLNTQQGGLKLLPEGPGTGRLHPGVKIYTKNGKKAVQHLKDGKLVKEEEFLEIFLISQESVMKITPSVAQGIRVASGEALD